MSNNNHLTIKSCYHFHVHQQHSPGRWCSQTTLVGFEGLPDFSPAHWGLSSGPQFLALVFPELSLALPGVPKCTQRMLQHSKVYPNLLQLLAWYSCTSPLRSQSLRRLASMQYQGLIHCWHWHIYVYTPHLHRHFHRVSETIVNCTDVSSNHIVTWSACWLCSLGALSPPACRHLIQKIFSVWLLKLHELRMQCIVISQSFNEWWFEWRSESWIWKRG